MGPEVYLFGARSRVAMAFGRMGMNGAQPVFRDPEDRNLLTKAGKENLNRFPDAAHIATFNPSTVLALIDEVERLRAADADA